MQESVNVVPGDEVPPLLEVDGLRFGMMTCYDLRFPELARRASGGRRRRAAGARRLGQGTAEGTSLEVLSTARALDNTCYVVAVGECGPRNIGASMVVDPLGVAIARAAEQDALLYAELDPRRRPRRARHCRCWPTGASPAPNWPERRPARRTRRPSTQGVAAEGSNSTTRSPR